MIVRVIIYAVVIVSATLFMLVTLNEMIKRKSKAPTSYQKAPIISTLGGPSHYYVENESSGRFSFVKAETFEQLTRHANLKNANLFIRPMHGREDWSNTISHEERENKTYFKINNKSDIEDFLAD